MDFFEIDNSDNESQKSYHVEQPANIRPDNYWYEWSDEENEEEHVTVFSRKDKLQTQISDACGAVDMLVDQDQWCEAKKKFQTVLKDVATHEKKFKTAPRQYIQFLDELPDLTEDRQEKTKDDFDSRMEFLAFKQLSATFAELKEKYNKAIQALQAGDDEEEEDEAPADEAQDSEEDAEMTEVEYSKAVVDQHMSNGKKIQNLRKIGNACVERGYLGVAVTALGCAALAQLKDYSSSLYISPASWKSAYSMASQCLNIMSSNPKISVSNGFASPPGGNRASIPNGFHYLLTELYEKQLQISQYIGEDNIDGSCSAYAEVPLLENQLAELVDATIGYYLTYNQSQRAGIYQCCHILMSTLGPRRQAAHDLLFPLWKRTPVLVTPSVWTTINNVSDQCARESNTEWKMRAVCFRAYQLGLQGKFREGRDLIFRSGVQNYLSTEESNGLSILFNRTVAQLGLAAFIEGSLTDSYKLLGSLWSQRNHYILMGQAIPPRRMLQSDEEELVYRDLLIAPHHHLPSEMLNLAALLSALIIDTTKDAQSPYEHIRHQNYFHEIIQRTGQHVGTPTELSDQVSIAYKQLKSGEYTEASKIVSSMKAWKVLPDGVLQRYLHHLKEAALRIFLLTYRTNFSTFSASELATKYDLEKQQVRDIINRALAESNVFIAFWDRDDEFLHVGRNNSTHLQHLVIETADTIASLAPFTEARSRVTDTRSRGRGGGRGFRGRGFNGQR